VKADRIIVAFYAML